MNRNSESLSTPDVIIPQNACLLVNEILECTFEGSLLFRQAKTEDQSFLFNLFAETRSSDLAQLPLAQDHLNFLLTMQYKGLRTTYAAQYPNARLLIICSGDGAAVGKVLIDLQPDHCRLVDLAVTTSAQRRGWGTRSILACQQACRSRGLPLRLAVSSYSSARGLYARAGFVERAHQNATSAGQPFTLDAKSLALFHELEWRP